MSSLCNHIRNHTRRYIRDNDGATAVEFAMVAMIFLLLIFSIIDAGRAFMTWNSFQRAVENATRFVIVNTDATNAEINSVIADNMRGFPVRDENISTDISFFTLSSIDFVSIDGVYNFTPLLGALLPPSWAEIPLAASSRMPLPED